VLLDRDRLPGEGGFLDFEAACREKAHVRWHPVARGQLHNVAGHEFGGWQRRLLSVAQHGRGLGDHVHERLDGLAGPVLLDEADKGVQDHDAQDYESVHDLAHDDRQGDGGEEYVDEGVVDLA
jgi:hypothetical protein